MPRRLLYLLSHIIIAIEVENISHQVERVLVVLNIGIQPSKIESVCEIVLIDFAEVFIAAG